MQIPLDVTFREVQKTEELQNLIEEKVEKLNRVCGHLVRCRVVIEQPQKHQRSGSPYAVRIETTLPPEHVVVVKREAGEGNMHDPLSTVIRDAFNAAERKLKSQVHKQRGEIKRHDEDQVQAVVTRLFPEEGYGFLITPDEKEVYFHKNSVLHNRFNDMREGTGVRYQEELGEKGPQASTVAIVDQPSY